MHIFVHLARSAVRDESEHVRELQRRLDKERAEAKRLQQKLSAEKEGTDLHYRIKHALAEVRTRAAELEAQLFP